LFPNRINSPLRTPTNAVDPLLSNTSFSTPSIGQLGSFTEVSSALANEFLNQSGNSGSFFEVNSLQSGGLLSVNSLDTYAPSLSPLSAMQQVLAQEIGMNHPPVSPLDLGESAQAHFDRTEGHFRSQLRSELSAWMSAADNSAEAVQRNIVAINIISCFHSKSPILELNAPTIAHLPECIGFLGHLRTLDLSKCRSLQSLPNVLGSFVNLQQLNLSGCQNITALPESVNALPRFCYLFLNGSGVNLSNPLQRPLPPSAP
jgi:Leucine-rich repeat (LRR) protein